MSKFIACCGLDCNGCGAYQATINNDDALREKTAKEWSAMYDAEITPDQINCAGCNGGGVLFHYPTVCEVRKCVKEHQLNNCSECPDYICETLSGFFQMAPMAKDNLEELRG